MLDTFLASVDDPSVDPPEVKNPVSVYLTFDDGPSEYTSRIVDVLTAAEQHAIFFMLGSQIVGNESAVRKLYIAGNEIGLHSFTHSKESFYASPDSMLQEFADSNLLIRKILQTQTRIVRIPYGSGEPEFTQEYRDALKQAGYRYWDWTIHANDLAEDATAQSVLDNIISQLEASTRDTEVILMHECAATAEMLPELLKYLSKNQYEVKTVSPLVTPINIRNDT